MNDVVASDGDNDSQGKHLCIQMDLDDWRPSIAGNCPACMGNGELSWNISLSIAVCISQREISPIGHCSPC